MTRAMTVSDYIRKHTREYGLPRKPCGCATEFSVGEEQACAECEEEEKEGRR
ncbi:hypothetical protein LCGC14_2134160, partial [marine sediment metagenome]